MSDLPDSWMMYPIAKLTGVGGLMVDGDWIESKDQDPQGSVRLIQLADIGDGIFLNKSSRFLTKAKALDLRCTFLQPGDLLIARMPDPLGRACIFPGVDREAITAVDVCIWRSGQNAANPEWLKHFINSPQVRAQIVSLAGGTTRQRISGGNLKTLEVPTPPLAEQGRIVVKLDNCFKRSTRAREEIARVPELVERYKRAILAAAFCGDLTANWRDLNPTAESVFSVAEKHAGRRKRSGGMTTSSVERQLPKTWQSATVDSVGEVILGRQRSPENHTGPHMRPYVRAANITWNGWDFSDVKKMNFDKRDFEKFKLRSGDVLINEGSGSAHEVGKPAIWNGEIENCCFQNTLIAVRPHSVTSDYLYFVLLNAALSKAFVDETRGVNIHHIGRAGLAQFVIPLPPIDEQIEIVRRLTATLPKVATISSEAGHAMDLLDRLEQAALAKAFRGDLVLQNPKDEPVSVPPNSAEAGARTPPRERAPTDRKSVSERKATRTKGKDTMSKKRADVSANHLTECLRVLGGTADAKQLWQRSEMDIDEFYKQLRAEMDAGRIEEASSKERLKLTNAA